MFCLIAFCPLNKNLIYQNKEPFSMEKIILGLTVWITIIGEDKTRERVLARVDTGATSSSIDIHLAQKMGLGPIVRSKLIKSASGALHRPIVKAKVKINNLVLEEEFNVADRKHMTYPLLIGQNILKKGNFLIDPSLKVA